MAGAVTRSPVATESDRNDGPGPNDTACTRHLWLPSPAQGCAAKAKARNCHAAVSIPGNAHKDLAPDFHVGWERCEQVHVPLFICSYLVYSSLIYLFQYAP